jgi:hypothetical protein
MFSLIMLSAAYLIMNQVLAYVFRRWWSRGRLHYPVLLS